MILDGDGDLDIITASYNDNTIAWYENDGAANPSFGLTLQQILYRPMILCNWRFRWMMEI